MSCGKTKSFFFFLILTIFLIPLPIANAQSDDYSNNLAFVVYSQPVYYGLNAGSSTQELRFRFKQQKGQSVLFFDLFERNQFYTIGAYNAKGVLVLILDNPDSFSRNRLTTTQFEDRYRKLLYESSQIPDENSDDYSLGKWLVPYSNILFSDKQGHTLSFLTDGASKQILKINDMPFFSLTYLFPYNQTQENSVQDELSATHKELMEAINEVDDHFNVELGMDILTSFQKNDQILTSVIISPQSNQVYLSLDKNAVEIWKFDINGGTVETYAGFDQNHKANIPSLGITTNDLKILNFSNEDLTLGIITIGSVIMFIIIVSVLFNLPNLRQETRKE